jgi:hypothetical protein
MARLKMRICRIITTLIASVLPLLPQPARAQKNIKVALALSREHKLASKPTVASEPADAVDHILPKLAQ